MVINLLYIIINDFQQSIQVAKLIQEKYQININNQFMMIKLLMKVTFCSKSLLRIPSFGFASTSNVEFHKATLASKIISIIRKSPLNDYRSDSFPSLKENILEQISNYEAKRKSEADENLVKQAAKEVRNCFEDGVYVPVYMCSQNRNTEKLKGYQEIQKENGQIQILNEKETEEIQLNSILFRKLSFVPTYVITGQIFRSIFQETNYNLLTGQLGVGKTYSFILYTLLSEMIFRYRHQLHISGNSQLPDDINFQIPKAVYLSMNLSQRTKGEDNPDQKIKQIFRLQCYELKDLWKQHDIFTLSKGLYNYYNVKFSAKTILLNDQINEAASIERKLLQIDMVKKKLFSELVQLRKKQKNASIQQSQDIKQLISDVHGKIDIALGKFKKVLKTHTNANIYVQIIKELSNQKDFPRILYLSSVDIEKDLLDNLGLMGDSKQGNIHSRIRRLDYPISLYGNIAIADTCELIALNLKILWEKLWINRSEKKTQLPPDQLQMLSNIKKLLNIAMRDKLYIFVLPLKIKQYLDWDMDNEEAQDTSNNSQPKQLKTNSLTFESFRKCNKIQLNQKLHDLIEKIQDDSIKSMEEKFTKFLNKEIGNAQLTNLKSLLSFRLWAVAENTLRQVGKQQAKHQKINNEMATSITRLKGSYQIPIKGFEELLRNPQIKKAISEIFFTNHSTQKYLTTYLNPQVIRSAFYMNRGIYYKQLLAGNSPLFDYSKGNLSVLGNFLQGNIITMLSKGQTTFSITSNDINKKYSAIEYSKIYHNPSCFVPIPKTNMKSYSHYYFLKSFKIHIQTLMKETTDSNRKFAWNLLRPLIVSSQTNIDQLLPTIIKRGIQKNQVDIYSKLIDFSLCQVLQLSKIVKIHLFDVTVDKQFMKQKCVGFLKEFSNFKDRNQLQMTIGQQDYKIELFYNVITTEVFNNDFEAYFKKTIKNLEKNSDANEQQLKALKSFIFKNYAGGCSVKGINENFCLSMIRIISTAQDKMKVQSQMKSIQLDEQIFKKVVQEVEITRSGKIL